MALTEICNYVLSAPLEPTDNANVSFVTYKGDYYVSTETSVMHKVDPETLESTKRVRCNVTSQMHFDLLIICLIIILMIHSSVGCLTKLLFVCNRTGRLEQIHCRKWCNCSSSH